MGLPAPRPGSPPAPAAAGLPGLHSFCVQEAKVVCEGARGFEDRFTVSRVGAGCLILGTASSRGDTSSSTVFPEVRSVLLKRFLLLPTTKCVPSLNWHLLLGSEGNSSFLPRFIRA